MNEHKSFQALLRDAMTGQAVEELKARHAYTHAISYSREEWDTIWSKSDNATWGHGFGRMVGYDEIYENSVSFTDGRTVNNAVRTVEQFPQFRGTDLRSTGESGLHVLASPVIEVAEDGNSARSWYLTPGTMLGAIGFDKQHRKGKWMWERYGSDFVYEGGRLKYFHEQVCMDLAYSFDVRDWAHEEFEKAMEHPEAGTNLGGKPKHLTDNVTLHHNFTAIQTIQRTIEPPMPYQTLDDDHTYSTRGRNTP